MKDLTRRGFLGLAGAAGVAAGLAACAGSGSAPAASGGGGAGGPIQFWSNHPGTSKDTEAKLIEAFQKANPGITVSLIDGGKNYEDSLKSNKRSTDKTLNPHLYLFNP